MRHGVPVRVFTTDANGSGTLPAVITGGGEYEGVPVQYFPRSWPSTPIGSRALTLGLRASMPTTDLVHIHGMWNRVTWSAAREARRAGRPYVVSPRGMLQAGSLAHRGWRKRVVFSAVERGVLAQAAWLHATSPEEAEALEALRLTSRIVVIPNGVDLPAAPVVRPAAAPFRVLFVGRLHPIKRLDLVIDAFVALRHQRPDARLSIAGPDEYRLRASLEARAAAAAGAIDWHGAVDAVQRDELLGSAHALVLCSDSESFGMSVVEAMAMATPVVVTTSCGWREVDAQRTGFRVPQSAEAIANALVLLAADPVAARQMGERGRRLVESRYAWSSVADSFAAEYARG